MKKNKTLQNPHVGRGAVRQTVERLIIGGVSFFGFRYCPIRSRLEMVEMTLAFPDLPTAFDGVRILQLTDIHYGPYSRREDLRSLIDLANEQKADLVALTGDFVLNSGRYIPECLEEISRLEAPLGVYAVLGNHDHREGAEAIIQGLESYGFPVLRNRWAGIEKDGQRIRLAGVADMEEDNPDLDAAFGDIPKNEFCILLSHNPDIAEFLDGYRADLVLSGHTHGGQFNFPIIGSPWLPNFYKKYKEGLCEGPKSKVFVSRGLGVTLLPLRIACPPQMAVLTLRRD
jgi:uncharacterized protein